jgi:hypothetical protein
MPPRQLVGRLVQEEQHGIGSGHAPRPGPLVLAQVQLSQEVQVDSRTAAGSRQTQRLVHRSRTDAASHNTRRGA